MNTIIKVLSVSGHHIMIFNNFIRNKHVFCVVVVIVRSHSTLKWLRSMLLPKTLTLAEYLAYFRFGWILHKAFDCIQRKICSRFSIAPFALVASDRIYNWANSNVPNCISLNTTLYRQIQEEAKLYARKEQWK